MSVPSKEDFKAKLVELYGDVLTTVGSKAMRKALCSAFGITGDDVEATKDAMTSAAVELVQGAATRLACRLFFLAPFCAHVDRGVIADCCGNEK